MHPGKQLTAWAFIHRKIMKVRPLLILLLFVVSAGILVWIFFTATLERKAPQHSPWEEILSDLDVCCRKKHIQSAQFDRFAEIADGENRPGAARLFRAMAFSERLHEYNCADVIVRFGGSYTPPANVPVFHGTTDNNLQRSIDYERRVLETQSTDDIDRALSKGNRYAARALIWAKAGNVRNLALMAQHHRTVNDTGTRNAGASGRGSIPGLRGSAKPGSNHNAAPASGYLVCPVCGNIYAADYCDPYCPHCLTDGRQFIRFE